MAGTCKVLQKTIFEEDSEESNVNLIRQGAEEALTSSGDRQSMFFKTESISRTGPNTREHCRLFAVASKAAKACELSDEIDENRIKVDAVLADMLNLRGFDAESMAEKKAIAARGTRTPQETFQSMDFKNREC